MNKDFYMSNISIFQNRIIYAELTGLQNNSAILSKNTEILSILFSARHMLTKIEISKVTFLGLSEGMKLVSTVVLVR